LVTLPELAKVGGAAAGIQLALALWLQPSLALLLISVWLYLFLMFKEFFASEWLKAHPFTYLWTHMLIMPLIAFYATACDWWRYGAPLDRALLWFLMASFFNGIVIEFGRKIRAPKDEEQGVVTYSVLLGRRNAVLVWLGAMFFAALTGVLAAHRIGVAAPIFGLLTAPFIAATFIGWHFLHQPMPRRARLIEHMSGVWTLATYVALGVLPFISSL
jgi:4-hydroxybenzoate polyprenyltransferase